MAEPLITGWEAGLAVDDSLARRFVYAYADRITAMAQALGGRVRGSIDARMADLGSPFGYDNAVVLLRPPTQADLEAVVAEARDFFPSERWWVLLSIWPTPDLAPLRLTLVGHPPLMLRPPGPIPAPPKELHIRTVDSPERLGHFQDVLTVGYPLPGGQGAVANPALLAGVLHLFVGYADGRPVSVAGSAVNHGLVEVDWVATLPEARGRGLGTALTAAAVGVAPDLPAALLSTDDGRAVYRRLGFLDLFRATMWEHGPEG